MRLKRLELQGFKSFAGKTTLDFPSEGVVAIVGPNGSGKSNVIDAIRWILGERESKNLRGGKSDDLIFSGTDAKSRVGFASASLYFDNASEEAQVGEFREVQVLRKAFRDGSGQYFLNKAEVRLKDLIDFFAGARLGARGLSVINQGNSDLFVKATPAERREMIEEILGLRQFQLKRHDAELKLNATKINLEKVRAMVEELLPRLKLLRRQTAKCKEREDFSAELKNLENISFALKYKMLDTEEAKFTPEFVALKKNLATKRDEFQYFQAELSKVQNEKPGILGDNLERQEREILSRRASLERELGRLEAKLEFMGAETRVSLKEAELVNALKHTREEIHEALVTENLENVREILTQLVEKIDEIFEGKKIEVSAIKKEIEEAKEKIRLELGALDGELENISVQKAATTGALHDFNSRFQKAFEVFEAKKDELSELERASSRIQFDLERIMTKRQDLNEEIRQIGRDIKEFEFITVPDDLPADFITTAERRMFRLRGELASIGEIDSATLKEAAETETRFQFLETHTNDLTKASEDLTQLIAELREKVKVEFAQALNGINEHFNNYFRLMFGGGKARLVVKRASETEDILENGPTEEEGKERGDDIIGLDIDIHLPKKGIKGLEVLSGGEKSLVSIATIFALVSVSAPPFLVLDEVDAALDENNTRRFANLIKGFSKKTQFIIVTHNRATMEAADILYGVTMGTDGVSKLLSVKLS